MINRRLSITSVVVLTAALGATFLPQSAAAIVAFNTFEIRYTQETNHDFPLLDARNASAGGSFSSSQSDHDNGVQANAGDEIEFQIYYHNSGVSEDQATNVIIRAMLPGGTRQDHEVSATISSDQTAAVSSASTARGGNMTIHLSGQAQTLTFVPGSVRWFPNRSTSGQTPANGDNLVGGGLNIGSVRGCFEFSGFVNFRARVGSTSVNPNYDLAITKRVLNVSRGETVYQSSTNASPNERVRFALLATTSGNTSQNNVIIRDVLPTNRLNFVSGSLQLNGSSASQAESDFFGSGRNVGTLSPGNTQTFVFDALVAGSGAFSGSTTLTNSAEVRSDQVGTRQGQATVNVSVSTSSVSYDLAITKRVLNATRGESTYQSSTYAYPGERVRFEIRATTSGNTSQNNVIIRDVLPTNRLNFVSGSLQLNGSSASQAESDFFGSGRNVGTLSPGNTQTFVFDALVAGSGAFSGTLTTVVNTANVRSDQVSTRQSEATVNVQLASNVQFTQRKTAYNQTQGVDATAVPANPGDIIVYTLNLRNTGTTQLNGIVIEDYIHDVLELAQITNLGGATSVNSYIRYPAVDIPAGSEITRTFQVQVRPVIDFPASSDLVMSNIYGNEVRVAMRKPQVSAITVVAQPPRTGAGEWLGALLAALITLGYWAYRNRKNLFQKTA